MSSPIDTIAENKRSIRNTRIALLIIVIIFVADLIGSYGMYEENQQLKQQVKAYKASSVIYENQSVYWKEKNEKCEANAEYEKQWRNKLFNGKEPNKRNLPPLVIEV